MPLKFSPVRYIEAFRVDVARTIMLIALFVAAAVVFETEAGMTVVPSIHHRNNMAFVAICACLLGVSWFRPAWTKHAAVAFFAALFALLAASCILVTDDPWRFGWLFPGVGGAYLAIARRGGLLWAIGAVCVILREGAVGTIPPAAAVTLTGALIATAFICGSFSRYASIAVATLADVANLDPLTKLSNRRAFDVALSQAIAGKESFALMTLDLDRFKSVNDTHGHAAGDQVLVGVAQALAASVRSGDTVARIGGEEFAAILPGTDEAKALEIAERVRAAIESTPFAVGTVTASIGVATTIAPHGSADAICRRADAGLYAAKHAGRNRIVSLPRVM